MHVDREHVPPSGRRLRVRILLVGDPDGPRCVQMHAGGTVGELIDALRSLFDVPLAADTLRHAHGGENLKVWCMLAGRNLALSACGVRDGTLLTVCADVRGGMEQDDEDVAPPPPPRAGEA